MSEEGDVDDDIPVLDASMLHSTIDFEKDMSWLPPVTLLLMAACVVVFGFEIGTGALTVPGRLTEMGTLSAPLVLKGEVWRLLSAPFLHASPEHIIGNMVIMFILGMACEHAFGSFQLVFMYVAAAVGGTCASLLHGSESVGASGAIFGMAGMLIAMFRQHRDKLHIRDHRIGFVIAAWATYQVVCGFLDPHIDNLAHVGGFGTGFILGQITPPAIVQDRVELQKRSRVFVMFMIGMSALAMTAFFMVPRLLP